MGVEVWTLGGDTDGTWPGTGRGTFCWDIEGGRNWDGSGKEGIEGCVIWKIELLNTFQKFFNYLSTFVRTVKTALFFMYYWLQRIAEKSKIGFNKLVNWEYVLNKRFEWSLVYILSKIPFFQSSMFQWMNKSNFRSSCFSRICMSKNSESDLINLRNSGVGRLDWLCHRDCLTLAVLKINKCVYWEKWCSFFRPIKSSYSKTTKNRKGKLASFSAQTNNDFKKSKK